MDTSILVHIVPIVIAFALGCMVYDRHPAKRLAAIKKLMRRQNDELLATGDINRDYRNAWCDLWLEVGPHEKA